MMAAPVLEAKGLSIRFGGLRAVDDVSFTAQRNRITTIIGPNGAGKSTLFNLISGALRPHAGSVLVEGVDYTGAPPDRLQAGRRRALVPDHQPVLRAVGCGKSAAGGAGARTPGNAALPIRKSAPPARASTNCWSASA